MRDDKSRDPGQEVILFGKYDGQKIDDIAKTDEGLLYLDWLSGQEFVRGKLRKALTEYLGTPAMQKEVAAALEGRDRGEDDD